MARRLAFTECVYQSPLGFLHYQCRAHDTRRPLQKRADTLKFRVLLRENQLDELSERSGSDQQCMDERLARFSRLCEEDATLNQLRLAAVVAADDLASATDGCDALNICSSVCSEQERAGEGEAGGAGWDHCRELDQAGNQTAPRGRASPILIL